jgi:hypothetical protein
LERYLIEDTASIAKGVEVLIGVSDDLCCLRYHSFYIQSSARPEKDIVLVAALVLRLLLGGEDMLRTLEETDATVVLSPKI